MCVDVANAKCIEFMQNFHITEMNYLVDLVSWQIWCKMRIMFYFMLNIYKKNKSYCSCGDFNNLKSQNEQNTKIPVVFNFLAVKQFVNSLQKLT